MSNPIIVGTYNSSFNYENSQNTNNFTNNYTENGLHGQNSKDVFYKFTLNARMEVTINHCGSDIEDTNLFLLNASGCKSSA